jgi:transcriptional regulator with XRE-family HTH domain
VETPNQVVRDVGRKLRELRMKRGWTQEDVAEKLGIALRNYQVMERGKQNLTLKTIAKLARVLGVRAVQLLEPPKSRTVPRGRPRKNSRQRG